MPIKFDHSGRNWVHTVAWRAWVGKQVRQSYQLRICYNLSRIQHKDCIISLTTRQLYPWKRPTNHLKQSKISGLYKRVEKQTAVEPMFTLRSLLTSSRAPIIVYGDYAYRFMLEPNVPCETVRNKRGKNLRYSDRSRISVYSYWPLCSLCSKTWPAPRTLTWWGSSEQVIGGSNEIRYTHDVSTTRASGHTARNILSAVINTI